MVTRKTKAEYERDQVARAVAASEDRRDRFLRGKPCAVCGKPMAQWGRDTHWLCDKTNAVVGRVCTCPPDCTNTHWGNGPRECDPQCVPCGALHGQKYVKVK